MRRPVVWTLGLFLAAGALAAEDVQRMLLVVRDAKERPLGGFRFAYEGVKSLPTSDTGATELNLPPKHAPGQKIKILLLSMPKKEEDWFLVNPLVNIPVESVSAEVVLMRRTEFRALAAAARDAASRSGAGQDQPVEERKRAQLEVAMHYGLTAEQLDAAIRSFGETQDPKDKGIAAYLEGQYFKAETLLNEAAEKKESDLVETLRYLGASQYEQAKYNAAASTFRKALALRGEGAELLSWLGISLHALAEWGEAEQVLRLALSIDEKNFGPEHPNVATRLNNLAQLLCDTNRLAEAEPLMRRALTIDETSFGTEHPAGATHLSNLAALLLDTNRVAEAELLMRRALELSEKSLGLEHPDIATDLNNLATLLQATNRLAEAEPLMRRALAIDERSLGTEHPKVATVLNNLGALLQSTNRLAEAEPLMRRALAIDEKGFGAEHPKVAGDLNNLAQLLQATSRLPEAEPLMRRAIAIEENSFGPDHPNVAVTINNLAHLLQATNRLTEAELLMRRALAIFLEFKRRTGHKHPHLREAIDNYAVLLLEMNKSPAEIMTMIKAFQSPR